MAYINGIVLGRVQHLAAHTISIKMEGGGAQSFMEIKKDRPNTFPGEKNNGAETF